MTGDALVLWTEGDWRCELNPGATPGDGRLQIHRGDTVVLAEAVNLGPAAYARAEILRQRLLRGDLQVT